MQFRLSFRIDADHPALPGHFPGQPVVPGVVLLDRVACALQQWRALQIGRLVQVKFLRPLLPGQDAELTLTDNGSNIGFSIVCGDARIASGSIGAAP
jgi:3-hydroxymyristoyl/3-hydroxydecanoyl-(acyl carrier protein) dehydratase